MKCNIIDFYGWKIGNLNEKYVLRKMSYGIII